MPIDSAAVRISTRLMQDRSLVLISGNWTLRKVYDRCVKGATRSTPREMESHPELGPQDKVPVSVPLMVSSYLSLRNLSVA